MRSLKPLLVLLILCAALSQHQPARGQRRRSRPSTPTLSPYMNLYRRDGAAVDNYNAYVRPERELRDAFRRQQTALDRQNANIRTLEQDVFRFQRTGALHPTGTGARFMSYSHYYPTVSSRSPAVRSPTRPSPQMPARQLQSRSPVSGGRPSIATGRPSSR
jgi:hypothetical protein